MRSVREPEKIQWKSLCERPRPDFTHVWESVNKVINSVETQGDAVLFHYTHKFDQVDLDQLAVIPEELESAEQMLSEDLKASIRIAAANIKKFHQQQLSEPIQIETMPGVTCWRKSVPIDKVGLYIPGGSAPLFSTVLMLAIPAKLAGCSEIVLCSPPNQEGNIHPAILFAANLCGVQSIYKLGGAQAIAAMGLGTESVPKVDKIFGPGNQYVTAAKMALQQRGIAIDLPAGPSEVLVYADELANPEFAAADLLSQAEHGPDSQVILCCHSQKKVEDILSAVNRQLSTLPRKDIATQALSNSIAIILESLSKQIDFINTYAPEHLILMTDDAESMANEIKNAGSVFLGHFAPESVGDYASGTNHTLPTNGHARAYSGVFR